MHYTIPQRVQYKLAVTVIGVFGTELQCTLLTAACQSAKFLVANIFVQTEYSAVSLQNIWHPVFLSRRSDSLELTA